MRKIEAQMIDAIRNKRNWRNANTAVQFRTENQKKLYIDGYDGTVYLHNNPIAFIDVYGRIVPNLETLRRWPTRTTMSRLSALGINVCQRNHVVYIDDRAVA